MDACGAGYHLQIARTTSVDKTLGHSIMGSSQMLLDDSYTNDVRCCTLCPDRAPRPLRMCQPSSHVATRPIASGVTPVDGDSLLGQAFG
jgi:hypothetical protein